MCLFLTFYLETTSLQAGPPQRGYLRYPIVRLCTSGQLCVALHTRTQRQTAFGELPWLCGGTSGERPVCLVVWILLAVSPVWLLSVSLASDAINQGPKGQLSAHIPNSDFCAYSHDCFFFNLAIKLGLFSCFYDTAPAILIKNREKKPKQNTGFQSTFFFLSPWKMKRPNEL